MSGDLVLDVRGISKSYKQVPAVVNLDLKVCRGQCLALLGPNGAGKTTTLDMLTGLVAPDAGTIQMFGEAAGVSGRQRFTERIGVVLQETNLYKRYTVRETFALFASFYRHAEPVDAMIERMGLKDKAKSQLRHLSGGERQRVHLGTALIHNPDLLFLDEPTTGLDPAVRREIWQLISELKKAGKSILLTTHYMEEASYLADEVVIIDRGRIVAKGVPAQLVESVAKRQDTAATLEDVFIQATGRKWENHAN